MSKHGIPKIEFGTDGIRGVAGQYPLDPITVLQIGRAIGVWLKANRHGEQTNPRVIVGRDTRISGYFLLHTLAGGLLAEGIDVSSTAVITTPGIAHVTLSNHFDLGIMISASHNPFDQNGIKLFAGNGFKLDDQEEEAIETLIAEMDVHQPSTAMGHMNEYGAQSPYLSQYITHLSEGYNFDTLENIGVVLDCANGAASLIAAEAFRRIGVLQLIKRNANPDGFNINVQAGSEYVRRDRIPMLEAMQGNHADIGIAFDGDADRVVFVTPEGTLVDGDHIMGILAMQLKEQGKLNGNTIVATDMSNSGLEHFLSDHGITLSRTKVGDRYVMDRMRERDFALGGEQAGHIVLLDDRHTAGDGIYIALMVAAMVAQNKRKGGPSLDELAAQIPRYPQVIASAHLDRRIELKDVSGLQELQDKTLAAFDNKGRVNIRFSGTEPNLLRAMVEGGPHTSISEVVQRAMALCELVAEATHTSKPVIDLVDCATGAPIAM